MLRCEGDVRLTRAEKRRLRILTGIDPETIRTDAALERVIGLHLGRYAGDSRGGPAFFGPILRAA